MKKIKAGTLIEVVISLVLIMVIFGIALMSYVNILRSSYSSQQLNAYLLLRQASYEMKQAKAFFDDKAEINEIIVIRTVKKYNDVNNLMYIHLEAIDRNNRILSSRNELIYTEEDE